MASKRMAARLATVGTGMAMAGALAGITALPASAAISTGRIQVINQGSYSAFLLWQGTGGRFPEGPHLYRVSELWYLLIAEGGRSSGGHRCLDADTLCRVVHLFPPVIRP